MKPAIMVVYRFAKAVRPGKSVFKSYTPGQLFRPTGFRKICMLGKGCGTGCVSQNLGLTDTRCRYYQSGTQGPPQSATLNEHIHSLVQARQWHDVFGDLHPPFVGNDRSNTRLRPWPLFFSSKFRGFGCWLRGVHSLELTPEIKGNQGVRHALMQPIFPL